MQVAQHSAEIARLISAWRLHLRTNDMGRRSSLGSSTSRSVSWRQQKQTNQAESTTDRGNIANGVGRRCAGRSERRIDRAGSPSPARSMAAEVVVSRSRRIGCRGRPGGLADDDTCDAYTSLANSSLLRRRPRVVSRIAADRPTRRLQTPNRLGPLAHAIQGGRDAVASSTP